MKDGVEAVDTRKPDAEALRSSAHHLESARKHLQTSREAGEQMLKTIPKEGADVIKLRVNGMIENTKTLEKLIGGLSHHLSGGKYPLMAGCTDLLNALDAVMATFKVNARVHQGEGF